MLFLRCWTCQTLAKWSKNASLSTKASLAKDWHAAFSSHGLVKEGLKPVIENFAFDKNFGKVLLTNHGLDSLYNSVQKEWKEFCKLDQEEKENFSAPRYFTVKEYWIMRWTISAVVQSFDIFTIPRWDLDGWSFCFCCLLFQLREYCIQQYWGRGSCKVFTQSFYKVDPSLPRSFFPVSFLGNIHFTLTFHLWKYCSHLVFHQGNFSFS